jgi:hypothetical protein
MHPVSDMQPVTPVPCASLNSLYCPQHCALAEVAQHTPPSAEMFHSDLLHQVIIGGGGILENNCFAFTGRTYFVLHYYEEVLNDIILGELISVDISNYISRLIWLLFIMGYTVKGARVSVFG